MNPVHRDALALPLVAHRGLWDKFAAPGTMDALRRSYGRGVPSVARIGRNALDAHDVLALVGNARTNPHLQPIFLVSADLPSPSLLSSRASARSEVFAITTGDDEGMHSGVTCALWRWCDTGWAATGRYLPAAAVVKGLSRTDLGEALKPCSLVLFESVNVIDPIACGQCAIDDQTTSTEIRTFAGSQLTLMRVSDLVEVDQLDLRIREAA